MLLIMTKYYRETHFLIKKLEKKIFLTPKKNYFFGLFLLKTCSKVLIIIKYFREMHPKKMNNNIFDTITLFTYQIHFVYCLPRVNVYIVNSTFIFIPTSSFYIKMDFIKLIRSINSEKDAIQLFQKYEIIPHSRLCSKKHAMKLQLSKKNTRWVCKKRSCRSEVGLRKGTWFEGSTLSFETAAIFIYAWSKEYATSKFCIDELKMSNNSIADWKNFLREICADYLIKNNKKIGGEGMSVEIDESCFSKRKYNVGRALPQQWVFGGICRENKECFMYAVPDRTKDTLLECIKQCINEGTTIYSDCWKSYDDIAILPNMRFEHLTVNHSQNFVDPDTGAHTQNIESLWGKLKAKKRRQSGVHRQLFDSYLCEFLWRHANRNDDLFECIMRDIKEFCPPKVYI